ncbi:MAG: tetratricopeptide repeat protein [Proteobacteria bacterium]|nr:tetratricopeptide repeat protein [Pseudomonadota bacterium]
MTHMSQLSKLDSNNKTVATVTASVHIKQGDYSNLVSDLGKTLNEKELIQFLNNAGAKLSSDNDVDGAIKMYQGAIAQIQENKFLYAIHYNLGLAYKKKNEIAKAITHFEKSLKLNPEFAKAASVLAELKSQAA